MPNKGLASRGALAAALIVIATPALSQVNVIIDRGLTDDPPYTIIYPDVLRQIDDGDPQTVVTVQHPDALLQCDFYAVPSATAEWTPQSALDGLDISAIELQWSMEFPGFRVTDKGLTAFQSGPALLYEGQADDSPMGIPVEMVHARAANGRWMLAIECVMENGVAEAARPMIEFIIANFSTRSDGECCTDPTDDRG